MKLVRCAATTLAASLFIESVVPFKKDDATIPKDHTHEESSIPSQSFKVTAPSVSGSNVTARFVTSIESI